MSTPLLTMFMMLPCPAARIGSTKRRITLMVPKTLTLNIVSQSMSLVSRSFTYPGGAKSVSDTSPALFTRTSTRPKRSMTSANALSSAASSVMSATSARARSSEPSTASKSSAPAQLLSMLATDAPASRSPSTRQRPSPRAPPVTTTTRPLSASWWRATAEAT